MLGIDTMVEALLPEWPVLSPEHRSQVRDHCTRFVRRQVSLSPPHIRWGICFIYFAFYGFAFVRLGMRPLAWVQPAQRAAALKAFARRELPPLAALERVLRSMTVIAYLEHPVVLAAIGETVPSESSAGLVDG